MATQKYTLEKVDFLGARGGYRVKKRDNYHQMGVNCHATLVRSGV